MGDFLRRRWCRFLACCAVAGLALGLVSLPATKDVRASWAFRWRYQRIKPGMTKDEVDRVMGGPPGRIQPYISVYKPGHAGPPPSMLRSPLPPSG